jgi:hypothetical protein
MVHPFDIEESSFYDDNDFNYSDLANFVNRFNNCNIGFNDDLIGDTLFKIKS